MRNSNRRTLVPAGLLLAVSALLSGCGSGNSGPSQDPASSASDPAATSTATPSSTPSSTSTATATPADANADLAGLEHRFHARVGLYALDTASGRTVAYRADDRFAHCSTVKVLAAGALLRPDGDTRLDKVVTYPTSDLVDYSPVTSKHAGTGKGAGMPLRAVIDAALRYSDNTAENLMLDQLGGPAALQRSVRTMSDATTRVDRPEPGLNDATPGDVRDTSTARGLGTDLRALALGDALPADHRALLVDLMTRNTTGGPYIRAGVPAGWKVADKTGSGGYGTRNDIAVVWPPHRAPLIISVLTDRGSAEAKPDDALIADATKAALAALGS